LGITIRSVTAGLADDKDLSVPTGVYVDSVAANSGADKAGVMVGDVITKVDGKEVKNSPQLMEIVARKRPGDKVNLELTRNGREKSIEVELQNREGNTEVVTRETAGIMSMLGADFVTVDKKLADKLDIKSGVQVKEIYSGKLARETEIKEGFIITKVNDKEIKDVDQLRDLLENSKGGILIEGVYPDRDGKYYYALGL